jgi:hypothetical protein
MSEHVKPSYSTTYSERIQTPGTPLPHQAQNTAEVIREHYRAKPTAIDKASNLEYFLFLGQELRVFLGIFGSESGRIYISATLVDLQKPPCNVLGRWT